MANAYSGGKSEWGATRWAGRQGDISDKQREIFKLAFKTTGRVAIFSDEDAEQWVYDYRFLEAVR